MSYKQNNISNPQNKVPKTFKTAYFKEYKQKNRNLP
jgi:hypothetical protein